MLKTASNLIISKPVSAYVFVRGVGVGDGHKTSCHIKNEENPPHHGGKHT